MNDLGSLATEIVTYSFPSDTGRFPVSYVSGWLESRIGEFNGLTNEEFYIDETGAFGPSGIFPVEEDIFKLIYEINYYDRAAREALRGVIWGGAGSVSDSVTMVKEGDTTIQKVSKHQVSRTFAEFSRDARDRLGDLLFQYNRLKASPVQVAGTDGLPS
jgi:hypothetical protein